MRQHLEQTFSDQELRRWFDPLGLDVSEEDKRLVIRFPHDYFASWFAETIQERFEERLSRYLGPGYVIGYKCRDGSGQRQSRPLVRPASDTHTDFPFGVQFTFDKFLVNRKNYFPLASAKEVTKQENVDFNPFVICGQPGSGKTHLLRAIANEMSQKGTAKNIFMGTVEDLSNLYNVRFENDVFKARDHFFKHDVLLVDDFGLIRKYENLQQELIILFDYFYDNKKQMVFSCSDKITTYDFLDPTLKSRLEWGLIVNLKQPDLDIRVSYIQKQCATKKLSLDKDQILLLAQRFEDFRYLQGILLKMFAFKELVNKDIGPKDFEHILSHTEGRSKPALTPEAVIETVADHFDLEPKQLKSAKRHHHIVTARQVAMYLCRQLMGTSYPALGRAFGGKDHSTALYAVRKIKEIQEDNKEMKNLLMTLKEKCLSLDEE